MSGTLEARRLYMAKPEVKEKRKAYDTKYRETHKALGHAKDNPVTLRNLARMLDNHLSMMCISARIDIQSEGG